MKSLRIYIALVIIPAMLIGAVGCTAAAKASDLMTGISPNKVTGKPADSAFITSMADFSIELFKKSITETDNSLISPLSVILALAMTANGADNDTLRQMESLICGSIPLGEFNDYLYSYAKELPSAAKSKLDIANSIWFKDDFEIYKNFLQTNADYYRAAAYKAAFNADTERQVNEWVKKNTDGMIDKILEPGDLANYCAILLNAVTFDAEWQQVYYQENINKDYFIGIKGKSSIVDFMQSSEMLYLDDGMATGFIKPYYDNSYSFAALLPNEGVSIEKYIGGLTGAGLLETLGSAQYTSLSAFIPKFKYDFNITLNDALIELGMPDAFDSAKADFSKMGTSSTGLLFIDVVRHKTFISVDELGTKAGAVAMVAMSSSAAPPSAEIKTVRLNRPFVFAIIDNATNLPVFIGTLMAV